VLIATNASEKLFYLFGKTINGSKGSTLEEADVGTGNLEVSFPDGGVLGNPPFECSPDSSSLAGDELLLVSCTDSYYPSSISTFSMQEQKYLWSFRCMESDPPKPTPPPATATKLKMPDPRNALKTLCLDLPGGNTTSGNLLDVNECRAGDKNQVWRFENGLLAWNEDPSKCVSWPVPPYGPCSGGPCFPPIVDCKQDSTDQQWSWDESKGAIFLSQSPFADRKCMGVDASSWFESYPAWGQSCSETSIVTWHAEAATEDAYDVVV
jgi:hypothetical protein